MSNQGKRLTQNGIAPLFEQHWQSIVESANLILSWIVARITPELGWKACSVRLEPSKIADNMDQLMLMLQMMQFGKVSDSTVLRKLGLDKTEETRKQMDEAMTTAAQRPAVLILTRRVCAAAPASAKRD